MQCNAAAALEANSGLALWPPLPSQHLPQLLNPRKAMLMFPRRTHADVSGVIHCPHDPCTPTTTASTPGFYCNRRRHRERKGYCTLPIPRLPSPNMKHTSSPPSLPRSTHLQQRGVHHGLFPAIKAQVRRQVSQKLPRSNQASLEPPPNAEPGPPPAAHPAPPGIPEPLSGARRCRFAPTAG